MKEKHLDIHSVACNGRNHYANPLKDSVCELNPEYFLFLVDNEFYLLTYNRCISSGFDYEFKVSIIEEILKNSKTRKYYDVCKSVNVNKDLKEFRLRGVRMKKYTEYINYIYHDNSGKKYAITTRASYVESMCNFDTLRDEYKMTKERLRELNLEWMIPMVDDIYLANYSLFGSLDIIECHKTIDSIVNSINKK